MLSPLGVPTIPAQMLRAAGEQNSAGRNVRGGWGPGAEGGWKGAGRRVEVSQVKDSPNSFPLALHTPNLPSERKI